MLSKKEQIWRYIIEKALERKERTLQFEQKEIATQLTCSTSTVFSALKVPRASNAVRVGGRGFSVINIEKLLTIWATQRRLAHDIIYETYGDAPVRTREQEMPPRVIFGGYSAYKFRFHDAPADYDKVYVYGTPPELAELKKRFPKVKGKAPNVFVLAADAGLAVYGDIIPNSQLYADLWNLPDWYAGDYVQALKKRLPL